MLKQFRRQCQHYRCRACDCLISPQTDMCDYKCDFDCMPVSFRPKNMVYLEKWETVDTALSQELLSEAT